MCQYFCRSPNLGYVTRDSRPVEIWDRISQLHIKHWGRVISVILVKIQQPEEQVLIPRQKIINPALHGLQEFMEIQRESLESLKLQELGDFLIRDYKYSVHASSYPCKNYVPISGFVLLIIILLYSIHRVFNIMCTFPIVFFPLGFYDHHSNPSLSKPQKLPSL